MTPKERKEQRIRKANENWAERKEAPERGNPNTWRALQDRSFSSHIAMKKQQSLNEKPPFKGIK